MVSVGILLVFAVCLTAVVAQGGTNENFTTGTKLLKGGVDNFWDGAEFFTKIEKKDAGLLERALEDDDVFVKTAASYALLRIFKGGSSPDARDCIRSSEKVLWDVINDRKADLDLREIAINILGECGSKSNGAKLLKFGKEAPEPELAMAAIYRAYRLTSMMKERNILKERLTSKRIDLRAKATFYLADMGDSSLAVKNSLKELAKEPTFRGMVAEKLIENEEMIEIVENSATGGADRQRIAILEGELEKALAKAKEALAATNEARAERDRLKADIEALEEGRSGDAPAPEGVEPEGPMPE